MPRPKRARTTDSREASPLLRLRFWGVRGSVPVPGPQTARYGGNTSCVEARCGRQVVILDAGTGIRELGKYLSWEPDADRLDLALLISHTHWDHIQGFPFFAPVYHPRRRLRIFSRRASRTPTTLRRTFATAVEAAYFPVPLRHMPGRLSFSDLRSNLLRLGPFEIRTAALNHPGGGVAFRLDAPAGSMTYIPDHEIPDPRRAAPRGKDRLTRMRQAQMLALAQGSHVLVHDAQYTAQEYQRHRGWGHSAVDRVIRFAAEAGARTLFLFHHDPDRDDSAMDRFLADARTLATAVAPGMGVHAAREGLTAELAHGSLRIHA